MGGLVWFDKIFQACQGPTSFIANERGWVIFEYSHVFRSGGSLMCLEIRAAVMLAIHSIHSLRVLGTYYVLYIAY
jgi:hypothetical protein